MKIKVVCRGCKKKFKVACNDVSYQNWLHGEDEALSELSKDDQVLIEHHVCKTCLTIAETVG